MLVFSHRENQVLEYKKLSNLSQLSWSFLVFPSSGDLPHHHHSFSMRLHLNVCLSLLFSRPFHRNSSFSSLPHSHCHSLAPSSLFLRHSYCHFLASPCPLLCHSGCHSLMSSLLFRC